MYTCVIQGKGKAKENNTTTTVSSKDKIAVLHGILKHHTKQVLYIPAEQPGQQQVWVPQYNTRQWQTSCSMVQCIRALILCQCHLVLVVLRLV